MKIQVTQEDIATGQRKNCQNCPIAIAIRRRMGLERVTVGVDNVTYFDRSDDFYGVILPKKAINFIQAFDSEMAVKPFSFTIKS